MIDPNQILPNEPTAILIGRAMTAEGPAVITVRDGVAIDVTATFPTVAHALRAPDLVNRLSEAGGPTLGDVTSLAENAAKPAISADVPALLAPIDLQAIKACGVTFITSMLERVIEEMAEGKPSEAERIRGWLSEEFGDLASITPGSAEATKLREVLKERGLWSQYLEVGLGEDAEIFTKAQPLSAVGYGATVGIHPRSAWNNPEPEVVLVADPKGAVVGACLGNDVNLRDFEGRSALLLGRAKDNTASCAVGPFVRLFNQQFNVADVRAMELSLEIKGEDGFKLTDRNLMSAISRDVLDLVEQVFDCHDYPDGVIVFTGTMFAPIADRGSPGGGFTHHVGDLVTISSAELGVLTNGVDYADQVPPWTWGAVDLMHSLLKRGVSMPG